MFHELRAVVCEHGLKLIRKDLGNDFEEFSGGQRGMAVGGPGKSESRVVIGKGDDVTSDPIKKYSTVSKAPHSPGALAL